ncbi:LysM peptidoglycan-binding domain-containing protein [Actinomycetospora chibensis]|uniref:LysM peptidoglycan-binding domain-containing protein n=1 Tax=Actinomycetospora chibensis TaxID=663606 RepID=A0ABV9RI53_9PSEU|nr:LysM peptidoglycan-binding domain-containing protein [Actinomycetospora chibensis]MDD7927609.1 LysM peptidoglycan-binding domain-containing protein [Actinomycetospora chibensis]
MAEKYVVVRGDTFNKIAREFDITTDTLRRANWQVEDINDIKVGQILNIPTTSDGGEEVPSLSVVVTEDADVARASNNEIDAEGKEAGIVDVDFKEDIREWLWQVNVGAADASDVAGFGTTELGGMTARTVIRVRTFGPDGKAKALPFHLQVSEFA